MRRGKRRRKWKRRRKKRRSQDEGEIYTQSRANLKRIPALMNFNPPATPPIVIFG